MERQHMLAVTFADSAFARWLRISLAALILVTGIAVSGILPVHRAAASSAVTTSDLNLRAGPSTGNHVKLVMPPNASVSLLSELGRSGFYKVSYGGETGYAYADYLAIGGSDPNFIDAGWSNAGSSSTTSALNLRQGPGTGYDVRLVMPYGAKLTLTGAADSGFVGVIYNGTNGWASEQYLAQTGQWSDSGANGSETVYTISSLNLRSGPSMSNTVLVVMPAAAEVTLNGDEQDGWVSVTYDGTEGWAASSYLSENKPKSGGTTSPSSGGNVVDIIYAAAARYGQNGDALLAVASCESGLNPNAVNSSSGASGLFQFLPGTWATTPYANQSIFDPVANAEAAAWMWSVGRRGEWYC
jgi:uncharacterized protein YraI